MSSGGTERRASTGVLPREGKGAITLEAIDVDGIKYGWQINHLFVKLSGVIWFSIRHLS